MGFPRHFLIGKSQLGNPWDLEIDVHFQAIVTNIHWDTSFYISSLLVIGILLLITSFFWDMTDDIHGNEQVYPVANGSTTMEISTIFHGKTYAILTGQFSMAM